ncbi:response regulator [Stieleria sp. JC731]|uniref:ATP-binding protein n=1 Tax=Pirellulaceae TaxID=2691357 RepID=UPI001E43F03C|nr:ATP-binding protein [Stieleria sp. JC731]MCC9600210.1 response regulator [Stieleria sp. JC731]
MHEKYAAMLHKRRPSSRFVSIRSARQGRLSRWGILAALVVAVWCQAASAHDPPRGKALTPPATQEVVQLAEAGELVISDLGQASRLYGHPTIESVPIDIHATVNYWDIRDGDIFVEDQFDALYVEVPPAFFRQYQRLKPGTKVRVRGYLEIDHFYIYAEEVEVLDEPIEIVPRAVHISEIELGELWSHYVRSHGKVREIIRVGSIWKALCTSHQSEFVVNRRDEVNYFDWDKLLNRKVEVTGTLSCEMDTDWNPTRYYFRTNEDDPRLQVIGDSKRLDSVELPSDPISFDEIRERYSGTAIYALQGQIAEVLPNQHYLLEQDGESLVIGSSIIDSALVGSTVDAFVYKVGNDEYRSVYVVTRGRRALLPPPQTDIRSINLAELPMRASLSGTYISSHQLNGFTYITLRDRGVDFVAKLNSAQNNLRPLDLTTARRISVSGLAVPVNNDAVAPDDADVQPILAVEVPSIEEVHVTARWWQFSPAIAIASLGVLAAVCTLGMVCFATLWLRLQRTSNDNRQLQFQLVQSQKLDALGRLTGGVAHDFNNLLTGIASNLELIERTQHTSSETSLDCLRSARRCTLQATKLVRSLLGFSRHTSVELLPGDINETVEETALLARSTFSPDIRVVTDLAPNLPACRFDQTQLGQVLLNLCFNAKDAYEGKAGTIVLKTQFESSANSAGSVIIRCADAGVGIDDLTLSQIFEPFFTTKKVGEGTGLGLSLAYGIVKQHGGTIDCDSQLGQGTTFTIRLPVEKYQPQPTIEHAGSNGLRSVPRLEPPEPKVMTGHRISPASLQTEINRPDDIGDLPTYHILLVDDDDEVRRIAKLSFEELGHRVTAVDNGSDALDQLAKGLCPDVVILDLIMPMVSGVDTLELIKQHDSEIPVIICSGVVNEIQERFLDRMFQPDACIGKPFRLAELDATLNRVCRGCNAVARPSAT